MIYKDITIFTSCFFYPQVDQEQMSKILTLIESGKKQGAKLTTGGARYQAFVLRYGYSAGTPVYLTAHGIRFSYDIKQSDRNCTRYSRK